MQKEKAKKNQIVVAISILLLFLFSFIISGFPVYARSPVVVIQPGHSVGYDPGATNSSTGITEAAVNAAVAGKVATKLKQLGYTVYLTHPVAGCSVQSLLTNAEANSLSNVANAINKIKPDLAISVHHNSGGSSASGYEFYWSSYRDFDQEGVYEVSGLWAGDTAFRDSSPCWAAQESKVFASVLERNFNGIGIDHRKTVERDDYVQAHVTCPSVLIEGGFISNPSESLLLASDAFQEKMSGRIVNSVSEYFGGATKDEKAPTADSITTPESPTTNAVFTVTANGVKDDLSGVSDVRAAVWCDWNDLKWYPANNIGNGQWSVTVDIKNHEDRVGTYYIDYYATDNAGNDGYIGGETIDIVAVPSISNGVSSVRINNNQFKVYAKGFLNYSNLLFPTWSNNDGMDDIKWYQGVRQTDGSYAILVDNSDHGYDVGKYYTDVYGTDSNGKQVYLGGTTQTIAQMTARNVTASEVKDSQFTVTVSGIDAPAGIREILVPVWSNNGGMDDLIWYRATRKTNDTYEVTINLKDHGYDVGKYYADVYGTDSNGKQVYLGGTTQTIAQMTARNVTAGEVKDSQFTVTVSGIDAPAGIREILVPVWSNNGGMDDLIWYRATRKTNDTYEVTINLKDHGYDVGKYYADVYGTDSNGKQVYLGGTTQTIAQMTARNVTASEVKNSQFTVTVSGIDAPAGIREILVPVWSNNGGMDDLIWYRAARKTNDTYEVTINLKDHGYDVGKYYADVYGTDSNGKQVYLGGTTQTIAQMTARNVTASEVKNSQFTVTVSGIDAPAGIREILVPVWSNNGGMDDLIWYRAARKTNDTYEVTINLKDHGYDVGKYYADVYGTDSNGKQVYLGGATQNVEKIDNENNGMNTTSIIGLSPVSSQQLVNLYNSTGNTFPSYYTENGRNVDLNRFAQLYIEEANAEGIRADVAFAQAMKETGWLKFGGQVSISQFNFAGLGATDDGAAGMSFAQKYGDNENGIRMGIRAQIQHLKAYASTEPLNNACVDERFNLVKRGCAPYVEWLGQKENPNGYGWATGANYGQGIIDIMNRIP
ncbi:hypothetical protein EUCA11A_12910 [Eubacterium callanderi]|nr:GBS Bsp-like repeat-containing protein [Eubacterium callanderi]WPK67135.1 hypothetical protein EUCA2A_12910 [Eubacterium callanderi]WPK71433.1 hypothetical protein EUCA11A_12910 [Eubacterium callanderi]